VIATIISFRDDVVPATINLASCGFNAVLSAVAAYVLSEESPRLAILGAGLDNLFQRMTCLQALLPWPG
jgi:hypothetical protein